MTKAEIKKQALSLSEADRLSLADDLVQSVDPFSLTDTEQAQLDEAVNAYQANPEDVIPAEEVHRELLALIRR